MSPSQFRDVARRSRRMFRAGAVLGLAVSMAGALTTSSDARLRSGSCATRDGRVLLSSKYGQLYTDDGQVMACSRENFEVTRREPVGVDGRPIRDSLAIAGRLYAYATVACDDFSCDTVINTKTFDTAGFASFSAPPFPFSPRTENLHEVPRLRVSASGALAWIVCRGAPTDPATRLGTRTSRDCLSKNHQRYLYVRRAADKKKAERRTHIVRVAAGLTIDPRYLVLTPSGRTVKWRQDGRLRVHTFDR